MITQKLTYYLERYTAGVITPEERTVLQDLICDPANGEALQHVMDAEWPHIEQSDLAFPSGTARLQNAIEAAVRAEIKEDAEAAEKLQPLSVGALISRWWWAAAIFIIGTTIGIAVTSNQQTESLKQGIAASLGDITPGSNKAILTLSNGEQVILDSATANTIQDGNLAIQHNNGALKYLNKSIASTMNTMRTPNGGQYQLVLSDGTKVWLNAASSITYPTSFDGIERRIKITGEAYFEVAKDKARPFLVDIEGKSVVEVLGTAFNVNAYQNEPRGITTTLVEGAVRVSNEGMTEREKHISETNNRSTILHPGQQATIGSSIIVSAANIEGVTAWKNGLFSFNNADLRSAMRQLERWYDIKVKYEGKVAAITISGEMFRNVMLSDVLAFLEASGVKCRMNGKELIIL